jgi:peptide/nickel transport system substrate-binding protein
MLRRFVPILFWLISCSPSPQAPLTLVWARGTDSASLDPANVDWGEDIKIVQNLYEPLVSFKEDSLTLEGRLATSWEFSPDGRTVTFELRKGVSFHDGTPLTADAVVFSFERLIQPNHPNRPQATPFAPAFSNIQKVEASAPLQVRFTLARATPAFLQQLTLFAADIVSPGAAQKYGTTFGQHPCGTGPYALARWDRDVKMELNAYAGYWGRAPFIPRVLVIPVRSPETAVEKLKKGEVHVVDHVGPGDAKALQTDPAVKVLIQSSLNVCCLGFNLKKAPYNDLNFRRAVSFALDRKVLNAIAYYDLAEPATNVVPPAVWTGISPLPEYEFDLAKAREALSRVRLVSKNVELIHVAIPRPYMPEPARVAEWVKDQLRPLGLNVRLTAYDTSAYGMKTRDEDHPMFMLGWKGDYPEPENYLYPLLHGDNAGDLNGSFFNDEEFNRTVASARFETDLSQRRTLFARALRRYRDELPTIPLVHMPLLLACSKRVEVHLHPVETRFASARFLE